MEKQKRQQILIKICCVIAAFGLWLYISNIENPIITYKLRDVPVELINTEVLKHSKLMLLTDKDITVDLTIKGPKNTVYSSKNISNFKIVADLSAYALKKGEVRIPVEIKKIPSNISVVNNGSLWINLNLDGVTEKKFPVHVNLIGKTKEGFYSGNPIVSPEYVSVTGGERYLNLIKEVVAEYDIDNKHKDEFRSIKLKAIDAKGLVVKNVIINPVYVDVNVPINSTKSLKINVKTVGKFNDGFIMRSMEVIPNTLEVRGKGSLISSIDSLDTETVDLSNINEETTIDAKVIIPEGITVVSGDSNVKIKIKGDKVIQKDFLLDVTYNNYDDNIEVTLEKKKVTLVVSGFKEEIEKLNADSIQCYIEVANMDAGEYNLPINITIPDNVKKVSISPEKMKVTIKEKEAEVINNDDNKAE